MFNNIFCANLPADNIGDALVLNGYLYAVRGKYVAFCAQK